MAKIKPTGSKDCRYEEIDGKTYLRKDVSERMRQLVKEIRKHDPCRGMEEVESLAFLVSGIGIFAEWASENVMLAELTEEEAEELLRRLEGN